MPSVPAPDAASPIPSRRLILLAAGTAAAAVTGLAKAALADMVGDLGGRSLTASTFTPLIDNYFLVDDGDARTQLRLVDVIEHSHGQRPQNLPDPFSLIFASPWNETLSAQTYEVENVSLGRVAMFITPVGERLYEAPFN